MAEPHCRARNKLLSSSLLVFPIYTVDGGLSFKTKLRLSFYIPTANLITVDTKRPTPQDRPTGGPGWRKASVVLTFSIVSCISALGPLQEVRTLLEPTEAERLLENLFAGFLIPVLERIPNGRVRSGAFDPSRTWGRLTQERIRCGAGENVDPLTQPDPVELTIQVTIRRRSTASETRIQLESFGFALDSDGEKVNCRLSNSFASSLLSAVPAQRYR